MRPRVWISLGLFAGLSLSLGCAPGAGLESHREGIRSSVVPSSGPQAPSFEYEPISPEARITLLEETGGRVTHRITLLIPTREGKDTIHARYSRPPAPTPMPLVVLLPALGGNHRVTGYFARYLVRKGFACLQPESEERILDSRRGLQQIRDGIRSRVIKVRRLLDWTLEREEIAPDRATVLGVSMGAVVASLVAATERRVSSTVLILGGGDLPGMLVNSSEGAVRDFRRTVMEREGWTEGELHRQAALLLDEVDPFHFANRIDPDRTLIIEAFFDRVIPPKSRREFWSRAGRPRRVLLPAGHYSSVLLAPYVRWKILRFLRGMMYPLPSVAEVPAS